MDLRRIRSELGVTGKGIRIALLDTGVCRHMDLMGKAVAFKDFVGTREGIYDDNGHGTHIAGILCGSGRISGGRYVGIAPEAELVVGKILNERGEGQAEDALRGLEWVMRVQEKYHIRIVNLSLGIAELKDSKKRHSLEQAIKRCREAGLLVVAASGNHCHVMQAKTLSARDGSALVVGTREGGPCKPDVIAWGKNIVSCSLRNGYTSKSGSSMATPIVSGCAALLWEKEDAITNEEIRRKICVTATDLQLPSYIQGYGRINLRKLLT